MTLTGLPNKTIRQLRLIQNDSARIPTNTFLLFLDHHTGSQLGPAYCLKVPQWSAPKIYHRNIY